MNNKGESPFTPGSPVPVELFVGRSDQIEEILRYVDQALSGKQENVFLVGDRGIGKTSLASFVRSLAANQKGFLGVHVFLGRVTTLEGMVHHIFDQILKEAKKQKWFNEITSLFGKYIKEIGLFGVSVSFTPNKQDLKELLRNFPEALHNLMEKLEKEDIKGLFLVLDDINGLADRREFADWYKSFADEVATHYKDFPVFIMLLGLPEKRDSLSHLQPSLMRIFRIVDIENLSDNEVKDFLSRAFGEAGITVKSGALEFMVQFSSGLPILMHEIGDATFWRDTDGIIDEDDAIPGIVEAAEHIGKKYLDPKVYNALRSKRYRTILRKLGKPPSRKFRKKDVEERLNEKEKKVFHNFLRRMRELGVIEPDIEEGRGAYRFVNKLYPIYIRIEGEKSKTILDL
jgi:hypothetical protein